MRYIFRQTSQRLQALLVHACRSHPYGPCFSSVCPSTPAFPTVGHGRHPAAKQMQDGLTLRLLRPACPPSEGRAPVPAGVSTSPPTVLAMEVQPCSSQSLFLCNCATPNALDGWPASWPTTRMQDGTHAPIAWTHQPPLRGGVRLCLLEHLHRRASVGPSGVFTNQLDFCQSGLVSNCMAPNGLDGWPAWRLATRMQGRTCAPTTRIRQPPFRGGACLRLLGCLHWRASVGPSGAFTNQLRRIQ